MAVQGLIVCNDVQWCSKRGASFPSRIGMILAAPAAVSFNLDFVSRGEMHTGGPESTRACYNGKAPNAQSNGEQFGKCIFAVRCTYREQINRKGA